MFAQITLSETAHTIGWDTLVNSSGVLPDEPLDAAVARPYLEQARAIVASVYAPLPTSTALRAERERVEAAVLRVVPWLTEGDLEPPEGFDFTIRCTIAHHRLPDPARQAREARIADILDGTLPDPVWRKVMKDAWDAMKTVAVVVPDTVMEFELRGNAAVEIIRANNEEKFGRNPPLAPMWRLLAPAQGRVNDFDQVAMAAANIYLTRKPADQSAFLTLLIRLIKGNLCGWLLRVREAILEEFGEENICLTDLCSVQVRVLTRWLETRDAELKQTILRFELDEMHRTDRMRIVQMTQALLDAVQAGVPLGDAYVANIGRCLLEEEEAIDAAQQGGNDDGLRTQRLAERAVGIAPASAPDAPEDDPVHAWSVARLMAWIEGPVTQKPLDRQRIVAQERGRRQARTARRSTASTAAADTAADTGDGDDIDAVVDGALQATAAFFLGDLNDLLALATGLKLPPAQLKACRQAREAMSMITAQQRVGNDDDTIRALATAERAIAALRDQIRGVQADELLHMRFTDALAQALSVEPLVPGKRHGGVIACPMPVSSWAGVSQAFHGRWLFDARRLTLNGQTVPLRPDQALALYVTGSSLSDFAFDVSVHLWQRRAGSTGPASLDNGGPRLMNKAAWFDTYIPCAMLHVPPGR